MDFWSRLLAGTSLQSTKQKAKLSNSPEHRLANLKRVHGQLLQTWRSTSNLSKDPDAADDICDCLRELTNILSDESRRPSPHICVQYASTNQIYVSISKLAITSYDEPIIREAVAFFTTLVESEEEDFLEDDTFSQSLMNLLVRITGANSIRLGSEAEVEVVELAFGIAAKIRLQPEILPAWFRSQTEKEDKDTKDSGIGAHEKFAGRTQKEDFPLFYLLIDYIHEDGRLGDFARTGLLYVIESASTSLALEQWLVESDLATLMATGLGALYSQLGRKLVIDYLPEGLPSILMLSDYERPNSTSEAISSASPEYQVHMDTFLSHMIFWQDVLEHCKSVEVKQTLLEHFQVLFLQQLLYPYLLESSDVDGGSSVAVLTYLRRILEALDHPDMIHLILHYLLALPDSTTNAIKRSGSSISVSAARKRKSMDLAAMMASQEDLQSTPALYNLVDLILGSLRSKSQQTVSVTLQLVSVILRRHHRYAVATLLHTGRISTEDLRTIGAHEKEMGFLLSIVDTSGDYDYDSSYENHIKDSQSLLENHPCSQSLITPPNGDKKPEVKHASIPGAPRDVVRHTLRIDDPLLKTLLNVMEKFLVNPVETNLCLTETVVDLAACGWMDLAGWLLPDPSKYEYEADSDEEDEIDRNSFRPTKRKDHEEQLLAIRRARRVPVFGEATLPPLLKSLETLSSQIKHFRATIPRFDELLIQRRQHLQNPKSMPQRRSNSRNPVNTNMHNHSQTPHRNRRSSFDSNAGTSRSASPPASLPKQSAFDSLAQRIFPDLATPSRSSSPKGTLILKGRDGSGTGTPRGRKSIEQSRSGGYGIGTPTSVGTSRPAANIPPSEFPLGSEAPRMGSYDSQSRGASGNSRTFSPSPLRAGDRLAVEDSQAAAFREIEKGILARRVGLPTDGRSGPGDETMSFSDFKAGIAKDAAVFSAASEVGSENTASETGFESDGNKEEPKELEEGELDEEEESKVSVSHILTNVVVFQEFVLELAALVQVRAGLFGEVRFV